MIIVTLHFTTFTYYVLKAYNGQKKPVIFVLPGAETNWVDIGNQLQKLHVFNESIIKSANILKTKGFNLYSVLRTTDPVTLRDPFVSVVASTVTQVCFLYARIFSLNLDFIYFQIALLDVLKNLKISPDYIVGESFGELAAAYAEGFLTANEAILSAYTIGCVLSEAKIIPSQNGKHNKS